MTEKQAEYLEIGMSINYSEELHEAYKERARSMVEDIELFDDILDHTVIWNYGKVAEIDRANKQALIERNTFSGEQTEWVSFSDLKYGELDKERIDTLINRDSIIGDILD